MHYANPPQRPIAKAMATAALLAHVLVSKYVDHLPLYRQNQIFKREGIDLSRSTMAAWIAEICLLLEPLYQKHRKIILKASYQMVDETPLG